MYVIFMEDDTATLPPTIRGFLAVPINCDGSYRWVREASEAYQYDSREKAENVLLGDTRFKTDDKIKGARIMEAK